jgi:hypothetical protein
MFSQLNPQIPVDTPHGKGWAFGLLDYSQEHNLIWVVAIDGNGEIRAVDNALVRIQKNESMRAPRVPGAGYAANDPQKTEH